MAPAPPKKRAGTKVAVAIAAVVGVVVVYLIVAAAASIAPFGSTSTTAALPPTPSSSSTDSTTTSSTDDTTTTSPNADPQAYLAAIHTQPHFDGLSDSILTTLGNGVCQDFSDGHDLTFVESDALNAVNKINANDAESGNNPGGNLTAEDAGFLIGAAVKGLCPQYTDQLPSS